MISTTAASARAGFVFSSGNNPQPNEQNILYDQGQTGTTVTGHTNQSNTLVNFSSSQTLNTPTSGAARLIAVVSSSNNTQVALTNVTISVPNQTFTDLVFNPMLNQGVGPGTGGPATVTVTGLSGSNLETTVFNSFTLGGPYIIGNGNNFATLTTTDNERITSVQISVPGGFTALDQPRISGLAAAVVPEPSTLTMLSTATVVGLLYGWRCHRNRAGA